MKIYLKDIIRWLKSLIPNKESFDSRQFWLGNSIALSLNNIVGRGLGRPHKTPSKASLFRGQFTGTQILVVNFVTHFTVPLFLVPSYLSGHCTVPIFGGALHTRPEIVPVRFS
jgi:hypothetical protein